MDEKNREILLKVAKEAASCAIRGKDVPALPQTAEAELLSKSGCFVTLKNDGELRGCIGYFVSQRPLIELVAEMARASAMEDPRFVGERITPAELEELDVEISVLSPLKRTDDPLSLRLGVDGIYIKRGPLSGCFLPQVATESGWSKEEFLSYCCSHKAGLRANAWKDSRTEVYLFSAEVFGAAFREI